MGNWCGEDRRQMKCSITLDWRVVVFGGYGGHAALVQLVARQPGHLGVGGSNPEDKGMGKG